MHNGRRRVVSACERFRAPPDHAIAGMGYFSPVLSVQRLSVLALLDESPAALAHAEAQAAAGDESWEQWVAEYNRGEALIVRLELTLEVSGGSDEVLTTTREGFFVENNLHAPKLEQQIAELASDDLATLAAEFVQRGHELNLQELATMYVHVELDPALCQRVAQASDAA
jgi:hypothetical protein